MDVPRLSLSACQRLLLKISWFFNQRGETMNLFWKESGRLSLDSIEPIEREESFYKKFHELMELWPLKPPTRDVLLFH